MQGEDRVPKFPESYIGDRADEYDASGWMERNQKRTTQLCVQYLYDEKLDNIGVKDDLEHRPYMILDLGCGSGFSSEILLKNEFRVIGVELLTDMISKTLFKKN